ncbi:MAG: YraN family protein [Gammaproteobacteria bacterium]|nr:YraN family protein [Gammaproteobacteria bacterium]
MHDSAGHSSARAAAGAAAEQLAARFLESQGLALIARNVRCRLGEIDLICEERGTLVIVEVRQRGGADFGGSLHSVTIAKQRRIARATARFLLIERRWRDARVRFDVVGIDGPPDDRGRLTWVRDAFRCV